MRTRLLISSFVVISTLITSQVILAFDNNKGLDYLASAANLSPSEQDWAAIALAAYGKTSAVSTDTDTAVTTLSREILTRVAQHQSTDSLVGQLKTTYQNNQFGDLDLINDDMFAILALAGADPSWSRTDALNSLNQAQNSDGGFNFRRGGASNTDMTAAALWALALDSGFSTNKARAWQYLDSQKNTDNGYSSDAGTPSNLDTTSWVVVALHRYGRNAQPAEQYLRDRQNSDGSWSAGGRESTLSTAYALLALSGKTLPFQGDFSSSQPTPVTQPLTSQKPAQTPTTQNNQPTPAITRGQPISPLVPPIQSAQKVAKIPAKKSAKPKNPPTTTGTTSSTSQTNCYAQASANATAGNGQASASASAQAWCE